MRKPQRNSTSTEHFICNSCSTAEGCWTTLHQVDIFSTGKVSAVFHFRYPSFCVIDYYRYPEEENDCCLFFSAGDYDQLVKFDIKTESKISVGQAVRIPAANNRMLQSDQEHSAWIVEQRTVDVVKMGGIRAQLLRICLHAQKRMGTLRMALRLPVTIATMLMLVSPLFGDLRTQVFVKLITLLLQTLCFLFLCSLAPQNGFAGTKPKIYTFFETVFILTLLSVVITVVAMALSRVKRTVPPIHNIFLTAKMINRFVCCIEPEAGVSYQRHIDDQSTTPATNYETRQPDYTLEWRHIFIAANNLFSGVSFTVFIFVAAFDIL
ncbi:unnamed protein product [Anisakis simplex]|uniref:Neur_chan_LBD domain-containing protein n=1 Tax=Anisakis simplex TaxID=6269 RepID=A0A0M3JU77_ANISI|nr:unnamed protein product [Anisakis simplex]